MRNYLIFACIMIVGIGGTYFCIRSFSVFGDTKEIDIREVTANPEAYAD